MWNESFWIFTENPLYNTKYNIWTLWLGLTIVASTVYVLWSRKRKNLPPGPVGLPIFGHYFFLKKKPLEKLAELARKYGNVFGLYVGPQYTVFLNGWEAVKDGLGENAGHGSIVDRPDHLFEKFPYKFGFAGANGAEWVETRRLATKVMKDGLERKHWEDLVEREVSHTVERIAEKNGKPIELRSFLRNSFSSILTTLLLGDRLDDDSDISMIVSNAVDSIMENLQTLQMHNFSEMHSVLLKMVGIEKVPPFADEIEGLLKIVSNAVDSNAHDPKPEENDSFMSRFQVEIDSRRKTRQHTYATEDVLKGSLVALMVGGNETTRTTIIWTIIAMADHPDKQKKVHEELDKVLGQEGSIRWSDKDKIPYTLASLLESMRWRTTIPLPAIRIANENIRIQGYDIPKGTYLTTNVWFLHNDPKYWDHPDQYLPERFLLEDGRKVNMAPQSYIPFYHGKRNCPGKPLALIDMLHYFCSLMQRFKVVPKEGDKVKYDAALGLSYQARNVEMRFIPR